MHLSRLLFCTALATLVVAAPAAAAPPPNDAFAGAQAVQLPSRTAGTTVDATRETGEREHTGGTKAVWYHFTPAADGAVQIDACTTSVDTALTVYSGGALNALTEVASDDDSCATGMGPKVTLQVTAGTRYSIAVVGFQDAEGTFTLNVAEVRPPANDAFADAQRITRAGRVTGSSTLATRELGEPRLSDNAASRTVWFRYRPTRTQRVTFDTNGSNYDTVLGIYNGDLGRLREVAKNDDGGSDVASQITLTVRRNRTYFIVIDGFGTAGDYELGLSDGSAAGAGLAIDVERGQTLEGALDNGLRAKLGCARPCRVDMRVIVSETSRRRLGLESRTLARIPNGRISGEDRELPAVLRFSRDARRQLQGESSVTVTVRAELLRTRHPDRLVSRQVRLGS